jgi:hypothetical protein
MDHTIHKITDFQIIGPFILLVRFKDATEQTIDFSPVLFGKLFGPLRDIALFNQVRIDPEVHTLVWPNGADFDPEMLYNWPKYADDFSMHTKQWKSAST